MVPFSFEVWDYDNGRKPLRLWTLSRDYLVIKIPGRMAWAGMGRRKYYGAEFQVFRVISRNVMDVELEPLFYIPITAPENETADSAQTVAQKLVLWAPGEP